MWKCALTMTAMVKSKFQKVTKYAIFYSSVIVLKISREIFAIAAVRDSSVLDIYRSRSLKTRICNNVNIHAFKG